MTDQIVTPRTETPAVELQRLADAVKAMQKDFRRGYAQSLAVGDLLEIRRKVAILAESMGFTEGELDRSEQREHDRSRPIATY